MKATFGNDHKKTAKAKTKIIRCVLIQTKKPKIVIYVKWFGLKVLHNWSGICHLTFNIYLKSIGVGGGGVNQCWVGWQMKCTNWRSWLILQSEVFHVDNKGNSMWTSCQRLWACNPRSLSSVIMDKLDWEHVYLAVQIWINVFSTYSLKSLSCWEFEWVSLSRQQKTDNLFGKCQ